MSQRKLLLADDSITIQKVVNLTFADEGIEVLTVSDGDAAMAKMTEFKPDLILADVNMPGLNGYQICEKIKQSDDFRKTPVILLVGSFEPFDEREAQRVGADDFLTKPFQSIRHLVSKVTELLDSDRNFNDLAENEPVENFAAATENETAETVSAAPQFGSAGFDDEMIQANQPSVFAFDESQKFESREKNEPAEDWAKTQPLSAADISQFSVLPSEQIAAPTDEFSDARNLSESYSTENEEMVQNADFSHPTAALEFDDDFLLELPPDEMDETAEEDAEIPLSAVTEAESPESLSTSNEADIQIKTETSNLPEQQLPQNEAAVSDPADAPEQFEPETTSEQNQSVKTFVASSQLSSETIDIIVQKVIERLSDKAVREIAWEVVPQMTDLIVRKIVEEKLKK